MRSNSRRLHEDKMNGNHRKLLYSLEEMNSQREKVENLAAE